MSLADARFASNVAGPSGTFYNGAGSISNLDFVENPAYASGDQCFTWNGPSTFNTSQCRVDWREGPRIAATGGGTFNVDQCFINCVGQTSDHADGMQSFAGTGVNGNVSITNTCFRSYDDTEAVAVYGAGFVGSDGFFWADSSQGTVTMTNVLFWGGTRGVAIYADIGTVHVNFTNVYFAPSAVNSFSSFIYDIRATGGTLVVDNWTNVFNATVVGGVIIPGSPLASP